MLLVVLLVLAVATLLLMDGHIVYSSDGIRLDLPFVQKGGAEDPPEPAGSAPLVIDSPVPTPAPTATPEPETLMQGYCCPARPSTTARRRSSAPGGGLPRRSLI